MSFSGYDLQNHRGLELGNHTNSANHSHYFYDPEGMRRDVQKDEQLKRSTQPPFPWRRYFARSIDASIYGLLFDGIAAIVFKINISDLPFYLSFVSWFVAIIVMLLVEPFFLSKWGTTPGKWIWGIKVTDKWGKNLEYVDARARTWQVLQHGYGFHIPFFNLYKMWKCYKTHKNDESLFWEHDTYIELKDKAGWRIGAYMGAEIAVMTVTVVFVLISILPLHRGDISVKEFSENFNHYAKFYGISMEGRQLNEHGMWIEKDNPYSFNIYMGEEWPDFQYIEENGVLKGITFEVHSTGGDLYSLPSGAIYLAAVSFMRAQDGYYPILDKTEDLPTILEQKTDGNLKFSAYGVTMDYSVQAEGYIVESGICWPEESGEQTLDIIFRMVKE